jgi:DNA polymerase III delta prime subunit
MGTLPHWGTVADAQIHNASCRFRLDAKQLPPDAEHGQQGADMNGHAIFFSGPIGVGKTTLGRAVARRIGAEFLDGDDFARPDRPWYASILSTSRAIAEAALSIAGRGGTVIIAYPLGCLNYVYYRRRLADAGHRTTFVSLRASAASILGAGRGRTFSGAERAACA